MNQGPETLLVDLNLSRCRQDISTTIYASFMLRPSSRQLIPQQLTFPTIQLFVYTHILTLHYALLSCPWFFTPNTCSGVSPLAFSR